jgi:hypothetical protein
MAYTLPPPPDIRVPKAISRVCPVPPYILEISMVLIYSVAARAGAIMVVCHVLQPSIDQENRCGPPAKVELSIAITKLLSSGATATCQIHEKMPPGLRLLLISRQVYPASSDFSKDPFAVSAQ